MTKTLYPILLSALCFLNLHLSPVNSTEVVPAEGFDTQQLFNVRWYSFLKFHSVFTYGGPWAPTACATTSFTNFCRQTSSFFMQFGWYGLDDPENTLWIYTAILKPMKGINAGYINTTLKDGNTVYIVDYDKNYKWFVIYFVDTYVGDWVMVLSKDPNDQEARARGLQLNEERFHFNLFDDVVYDDRCDFREMRIELQKHRS